MPSFFFLFFVLFFRLRVFRVFVLHGWRNGWARWVGAGVGGGGEGKGCACVEGVVSWKGRVGKRRGGQCRECKSVGAPRRCLGSKVGEVM